MSNLNITTQERLLAYIKENLTSNSNLSIVGLARLCHVADTSIIRGSAFANQKLAVILSAYGFETSALVENGFNAQATWLVIEYFAYESKAKAEGAKQIARTFGTIGVMQTFEKLSQPEQQSVKQLPYRQLAVEVANSVRHITDTLSDNPRLAQVLSDIAMNDVLPQKQLPGKKLRGVVEIAHELGYKTNSSNRVILGKFIKDLGFNPVKETRLCNGIMTKINCYEDTDELREAITTFFTH
ncbi:hypothetical protein [Myxosarcina sp. GI1(2024)]